MRLYNGAKYDLMGFQRVFDGNYWVLHERSQPWDASTAYVIVNELKFVDNGNVFFLFNDGRIESNHKLIQAPQLNYVYE